MSGIDYIKDDGNSAMDFMAEIIKDCPGITDDERKVLIDRIQVLGDE